MVAEAPVQTSWGKEDVNDNIPRTVSSTINIMLRVRHEYVQTISTC